MKHSRFHLNPAFPDLIARAGLSQRAFAQRAGVSLSTIAGLIHPRPHLGRRGSMQRRTAWLLARAYAEVTGMSVDEAFRLLICEQADEEKSAR
ncbi:MAG: helix-turn-helix transcriptional regulator [Roseiflexaceae bacterium]|nr:helix-turn-helix transcriptional regulator [Roseiflexus sp.]MDW8214123.1 helix-turn-helix transcriptional regulator [Roseiflexaceae bacterium]